ncbi:hypothetical protein [Nostoc sp. CMAA1605]|uniref:hypothetical protein n=1 Tax=Nostoc sp. CMAA1605 TaxID=2055159 RepID=UPI001F2A658A|nr:hypothetical protein [Nostoc sp. CMAA1605]
MGSFSIPVQHFNPYTLTPLHPYTHNESLTPLVLGSRSPWAKKAQDRAAFVFTSMRY